jgi:hypothetical protein
MNGNKAGTATERSAYALGQLVRDLIVAGSVSAIILFLTDNGHVSSGSGLMALGIWRILRMPLLEWLDANLKIPGR